MIKLDELKRVLNYNPNTGCFRWLIKPRTRSKKGDIAGSPNARDGYRRICVHGKFYLAHRLAWFYMTGKWPVNEIDHIDADRNNDRFSNLRDVTKSVNQRNRSSARPDSKLGLIGVGKSGRRYIARLQIGTFDTSEEAHLAYKDAVKRLGLDHS